MDSKEVTLLKKALARQKMARQQAEKLLEQKSLQLYEEARHLKESNHKLENLLSEKTSELDGVFINIIDPYVVMDLSFNVISMNQSAKNFLGHDHKKDTINLWRMVHKDYMEYTIESFSSLQEVGKLKNYRAKIIVKDDVEKWVEINASLIYNKDKQPIAAQGIVRDITQEMEVTEMLSEQKRQLDIIVNASPLGIVLANTEKIIKVNHAMTDLLGYSFEEFKMMSIDDITATDDVENSNILMQKIYSGEIDDATISKKYVKKNGEILYLKVSLNSVKNIQGKTGFVLAMLEDITKQKELEIQKEQLLNDLENSNQSLQEYAHIVSHDLKSPLRSISALATWLSDDYKDVLDEPGRENLSLMQEKVASMDKLIHGILEYSTANNSALDDSKVDLNEVINDIGETIFIPDHVKLVIPETLPTIIADRTKVHQVFQNIIGNAVVHIEREVGLVEVLFNENKDFWQFTISDNGVGIPEEYHKKIFDIFQSIGNNERSTGIGLSIVKKIIDRYQGKVWVDSVVGEGTQFHFTIKKTII